MWDAHAQRIVWATDEGARLWGLEDAFLLIDRPFGPSDPATEDLMLAAGALAHTEGIESAIRLWQSGRKRTIGVVAMRFARTPQGDLVLFTPQRRRGTSARAASAPGNPIADLLGSFPLGLAVFSPGGQCLYGNPAFERILGPASRISFSDVMGSQPGGERLVRALLAAGTLRVTPTLTRGGTEMTLQIDAALIQDPAAGRSAFLVQAQDVSSRRGRERQLSERFEMVKSLLERAVEGWAVLDRRLRVKALGGRLFDREGVDAGQALGGLWREACEILGLERDADVEGALLARQAAQARLKDGGQLLTATPQWSEDGDFEGYQLIISGPEYAAQSAGLAQAQERPARALDIGAIALIAHENFDIVYANTRAAKLFGAESAAQLIGKPFLSLFRNDERRASRHYDELAVGADESSANSLEAATIGGGQLYLDAEFRPARLAGKPVVLASFQDVTRFMAERALNPQTEENYAWLDAAPTALLVIDSKGRISRANSLATRLLSMTQEQLIGRALVEMIGKADRTAYEIRRAAATSMVPGLAATLEARLQPGGDLAVNALVAMRPAFGSPEPDLIVALTNLDAQHGKLEELQSALEHAGDANRQKSDFLSAISHEMRTPLNAIIGFSEVMREGRLGPIGNQRYAEYADDIHMSGQHLLSLVNDLLDMSKIEAGRYELEFAAVDVDATVDQAMRIIRPQADKKTVSLVAQASAVPQVMADQRSLLQILLNLLSNAVKFTPSAGAVTVKTSSDPIEGVKIEVADTGAGMSTADIARALEPYRQVHRAHANDERGTGLGLPLAKAMTEANHARFSIQSTPGQGTRVAITFPIAQVVEGIARKV